MIWDKTETTNNRKNKNQSNHLLNGTVQITRCKISFKGI